MDTETTTTKETTTMDHALTKNRSYQVRRQVADLFDKPHGHDFHVEMPARLPNGRVADVVSTSNAGFRGIEMIARVDGHWVPQHWSLGEFALTSDGSLTWIGDTTPTQDDVDEWENDQRVADAIRPTD